MVFLFGSTCFLALVNLIDVRDLTITNRTRATLPTLTDFCNISQASFSGCLVLELFNRVRTVEGLADLLESDASCFNY
jgi:hypothetical protein